MRVELFNCNLLTNYKHLELYLAHNGVCRNKVTRWMSEFFIS